MVSKRWKKRLFVAVLCAVVLAGLAFGVRRTIILEVARVALNRDPGLAAQERKDGVAIEFVPRSPHWVTVMKNEMNEIWLPAKVQGVNYYTFGGPRNPFRPYSERSNPRSPYYQAWIGGYVIKTADGSVPADPQALASELTNLDQRSWLEAMGDPQPVSELESLTSAGNIDIGGTSWPLWHGVYRSHSDLSADSESQLAGILGMPKKSSWPVGVSPFHDVTLDGYLAWKVDTAHRVTLVIYAVAGRYAGQSEALSTDSALSKDELLSMMRSAAIRPVVGE